MAVAILKTATLIATAVAVPTYAVTTVMKTIVHYLKRRRTNTDRAQVTYFASAR